MMKTGVDGTTTRAAEGSRASEPRDRLCDSSRYRLQTTNHSNANAARCTHSTLYLSLSLCLPSVLVGYMHSLSLSLESRHHTLLPLHASRSTSHLLTRFSLSPFIHSFWNHFIFISFQHSLISLSEWRFTMLAWFMNLSGCSIDVSEFSSMFR